MVDPIINRTSIYHPGDHHPPTEAAGELPGRFDLGVARRNGTLGDVLDKIGDAKQELRRAEQLGPVQYAMEAACTKSIEDRKTFSIVMAGKDINDCYEEICRFDSERRAGEFGKIRNLPALLTTRLKSLPDKP